MLCLVLRPAADVIDLRNVRNADCAGPSRPTVPLESHDMSNRLFSWLLLLISLGALVARLWVGARTYLEFDEWQHIFMASVPRWADLRFELATNAHPPLFFLLL